MKSFIPNFYIYKYIYIYIYIYKYSIHHYFGQQDIYMCTRLSVTVTNCYQLMKQILLNNASMLLLITRLKTLFAGTVA